MDQRSVVGSRRGRAVTSRVVVMTAARSSMRRTARMTQVPDPTPSLPPMSKPRDKDKAKLKEKEDKDKEKESPTTGDSLTGSGSDQSPSEREWTNRKASEQAIRAANARRNSGRRRFIDPTTCERDYSSDELEFMQAMQEYKKKSGRMFPTWSEVLEVLRSLGYEKSGDLNDFDLMKSSPGGSTPGSQPRA